MNYLTSSGSEQTLVKIYVQPGASKNELVGLYGDPPRLKLKVKAPPQDGEANLEVISFMAIILGISKSKVQLIRGQTSRKKDLLVDLSLQSVIDKII
jgi:uncharacterized protein (TIGR00251 family)